MACSGSDCPVVGDLVDVDLPGLDAGAAAVTVSVRRPDGGVFSAPGSLVAGSWYVSVVASQPGQWWFRAESTGPTGVVERARLVAASRVTA